MKKLLLELDDKTARDLERVAPASDRKRNAFIRAAVRFAIDVALDRQTELAYRAAPLPAAADLTGWDPDNQLAVLPKRSSKRTRSAA